MKTLQLFGLVGLLFFGSMNAMDVTNRCYLGLEKSYRTPIKSLKHNGAESSPESPETMQKYDLLEEKANRLTLMLDLNANDLETYTLAIHMVDQNVVDANLTMLAKQDARGEALWHQAYTMREKFGFPVDIFKINVNKKFIR